LTLAFVAISAGGALAGGGAPTVETERASSVGHTSVVLNASVNPNNSSVSECYFEYGTSETSLSSTAQCTYSPGAGETSVPVEAKLEGLPESTTYYFRIHAKSSEGESTGRVQEVTTLPTSPRINTGDVRPIGHTTATVNAVVTPNDSEVTECYVEYGSSPSELNRDVACSPLPGAGSEGVAVTGSISALQESTTYYFRVLARNAYGLTEGGRGSFETLPAVPKANTEPAQSVTHTSATLRGFVTPNDAAVEDCYFEWGTASVEEHSVPCEPTDLGSGEQPVAVSAQLTGLRESETYRYRLVASNDQGTGVGGTARFTTLPYQPKVQIKKAEEVTGESTLLRASVNPEGSPITECSFEYGTTPALGESARCSTLPGAGEGYVEVSAPVSGLSPTTGYVFRVKARNEFGVAYTRTESFTTFKAGELPVVTKVKPSKGNSAGGTSVTIKGAFLEDATAVTFGETETTDITHDSADSLTVISPPGVGQVDVIVTTPSGESKISSADHFTYGAPAITGLSPSSGSTAGGSEVTVTGSGFEPGTSGTKFVFGTAAGTLIECPTSTTCTVISPPAHRGKAGVVAVRATVNGKKSAATSADAFEYTG
jgi:phosphodiesterase/alkaline phosphatase D-like protein